MKLFVVGISHKTAPVEIRECLTIPENSAGNVLQAMLACGCAIREAVILSTCNRVEAYGVSPHVNLAIPQVEKIISQTITSGNNYTEKVTKNVILNECEGSRRCSTESKEDSSASPQNDRRGPQNDRRGPQNDVAGAFSPPPNDIFYHKTEEEAVKHLFSVASGLDSMVIGEHEILGQVKAAYHLAHKDGTTGKFTNVLFQRAIYIGKFVRTHTVISQGQISVGSMAVSLAERIFGDLKTSNVLVLGAGKMAEVTTKHLISQKVKQLVIINRTFEKALELTKQIGGKAAAWENIPHEVAGADIVICSTGAENWIITKELMTNIMHQRKNKAIFMIDISVPRNIEPGIHTLDNVYLYNIDDLESLIQTSLTKRMAEINKACSLVETRTGEFMQWLESVRNGQEQSLRHKCKHYQVQKDTQNV